MTETQWTYLFVGLTFTLYLVIAWLSRVRDTKGFYVAGRGVPAAANGMATAADWMSAASFLSMAGLVATMGYAGGVYLMGWTGGYVLLALLLAPYLRIPLLLRFFADPSNTPPLRVTTNSRARPPLPAEARHARWPQQPRHFSSLFQHGPFNSLTVRARCRLPLAWRSPHGRALAARPAADARRCALRAGRVAARLPAPPAEAHPRA